LRSIRAQTYPNVEVIVVDNYSKDKTREMKVCEFSAGGLGYLARKMKEK